MKRIAFSIACFLTGALLSACTTGATLEEKPRTPKALIPEPQAVPEPAWQVEWEKAIKQGQGEGKVVIYSTYSGEARAAISEAFKAKHDIKAEFMSGRGAELREKLFRERRAGLYLVDFFMMGLSEALFEMKDAGELNPLKPLLILPEVMDPKVWWGERGRWADGDGRYIFRFTAYPSGHLIFNSGIVKTAEINSWHDLLAPRWKGRIMINDPTTTGGGSGWYTVMSNDILGLDYMRQLARQEPILLRDQRLQAEWLAREKYPLSIAIPNYAMAEFVRIGVPIITKILAEGGYITQGAGAIWHINRAPHPQAARVFVNWLLTREGQTLVSRLNMVHSARIDVPTDHLLPEDIRQEGVKYYDPMNEHYYRFLQTKGIEQAKEIFGHLLK